MTQTTAHPFVKQFMATLQKEPRIKLETASFRASVLDNALILEGIVEDIATKRIIAQTAHRLNGTHAIQDRVRVRPGEAMQDAALRDEVLRTLESEPVFSEYGLAVVTMKGEVQHLRPSRLTPPVIMTIATREGVVTLTGEVGSLTQRRLAEVLTWWTAGCELVINQLHVTPPEADSDGELIDAIQTILEKDPFVHADHFTLRADHGTVTLSGHVASDEERRLAVLDAWYVPGVHEVINKITVGR
jgi:osmotically-inducible protein OsmY